ncbi:RNA polymerase sigma factor (sigma-70 family) [Streptomyces griseochromogenes]|uniref:RNA polymerase sigma factor n=1 Tax=Streptomyces griseochromogenes TaxID=68214 RepID=A0A1B1B1A8_9ACTN|nr:sigma-70 family RNA polymerase sigma factor [Streptomyces griseochromogenes]ANP52541.1 RNA polymerase [Streptomyces griseochromogenes]MBP2047103.1 RNA polymerase sigma factor (sigma-70 family) [Streptomyces griseochromogenes]
MSTQHAVDSVALVNAARAGDPGAQDALVSAYLPLVYNIVGRALNGSVDVDDVVQDTMLRALDALDGLRTPESFRSWLVAIAMNQVRAHWQDRQLTAAAVEEAEELADPGADFVDLTMVRLQLSGQRRETASATRWLEPDDRGLLSLWWLECAGELTRGEVAAALELSPQHTAVRVQRMKAQLEAARVVVRALDAQPPCEELRGVLASWDGRPSALWRKRIARHARDCVRCSGLWSGLMPAEGLLAGLALIPVSAALLAKMGPGSGGMALAGSASLPDASADHAEAAQAGGHAAPRGRAGSRGEARRRKRIRRRAVGGAVVAACVAGGGLWYFGTDGGAGTEGTTTTQSAGDPVVDLSAPSAVATSPSASAKPSPSPSKTKSAKKTPHPAKKTASAPVRSPRPTRTASAAPQPQPAPAGTVAQVVALVNKERAAAGCGPLTENAQLDKAAQGHSDDMAARNFFDHTNPDGADPGQRITAAGYHWSTYGENIAMGQQTPQSVMDSWMNSPGHRANILNCSFKDIGVGVHKGSGGPWWTQDFGAKL